MNTWLSVGALDRVDEHRKDADWIAGQWRHPRAQLLVVTTAGAVASDPHGRALAAVGSSGAFDPGRHLLLGLVEGRPWFAAEGEPDGPTSSLRQLGAVLTGVALELVVGAVALTAWHRLEPYCSRCGSRTEVSSGGTARRCPSCRATHFPRQDPAVIVAVLDPDDRILLGRQASWDPGRMSVLAGFVEAGESLEQAVHREVLEESGVRLAEVRYRGSQPWPFPRSLMLGFVAQTTEPRLRIIHDEIETADWYNRDQLAEAIAAGRLRLPSEASIAHRLIAAWRYGAL